jgi:N-acetylneuraminic acid mutarotase
MKRFIAACVALLFACAVVTAAEAQNAPKDQEAFRFSNLPKLPRNLRGAFVGQSGGAMIVAGGAFVAEGREQTSDEVLVLPAGQSAWKVASKLPSGVAHGATATVDDWLVCAGGMRDGMCLSTAMRLRWHNDHIELENLPELPAACAQMGAAVFGDLVFVAGGQDSAGKPLAAIWSMGRDHAKWSSEQSWPGSARIGTTMAA